MVKGMIFDVGGVLAHDVWENLLPARDKLGGIAAKFDLDKDHVHRVGELLWEAFAYRQEALTIRGASLNTNIGICSSSSSGASRHRSRL